MSSDEKGYGSSALESRTETDSGSRLFSRETTGPKPLPIIEPPPALAVTVSDKSISSTSNKRTPTDGSSLPSEWDFVAKVYNTALFVLVMAGKRYLGRGEKRDPPPSVRCH